MIPRDCLILVIKLRERKNPISRLSTFDPRPKLYCEADKPVVTRAAQLRDRSHRCLNPKLHSPPLQPNPVPRLSPHPGRLRAAKPPSYQRLHLSRTSRPVWCVRPPNCNEIISGCYNTGMGTDALELFLPPVQHWFRSALGEPTAAQRLGWPAIAAGQHTLILAPTGSRKMLAAFLAYPSAEQRSRRTRRRADGNTGSQSSHQDCIRC